jgi:hypothetical protein
MLTVSNTPRITYKIGTRAGRICIGFFYKGCGILVQFPQLSY